MKKMLPFILLGIAALFLGGWGAMATTSASTGGSGGDGPEYGEYGSDSYLDGLMDECASGDISSCEDLYYESPAGSEYESAGENGMYGGDSSEAMYYGDDPYLDSLYDSCAYGDEVACEDLYYQSPVDSEYEDFAYSQPW